MCGFAIWPTNASLPAGGPRAEPFRYAYRSSQDVVGSLPRAFTRHGIGLGTYYSVNANEYLNYHDGVRDPSTLQPGQVAVSAEEYVTPPNLCRIDASCWGCRYRYAELALQQLDELWTRYGQLAEIWFDGGRRQREPNPQSPGPARAASW